MTLNNTFVIKSSLTFLLSLFSSYAICIESSSDALAQKPIVESTVNLNLPYQVMNSPSSIDEIFYVLKNLDFKPVPGASLFAKDNPPENDLQSLSRRDNSAHSARKNIENNLTSSQNNTKSTLSTPQADNRNQFQSLEKEIERLQNENNELRQKIIAQPSTNRGLNQIANNLVQKFSQEREKEHQEAIVSLEKELASVKNQRLVFENQIKALIELPKEGDAGLIKKLEELTKTYETEKKILIDKQNMLQKELNDKTNTLAITQRELEQLEIIHARNENLANKLSNKLANSEDPLKIQIDNLTQENIVLKKALQEETLRVDTQIKLLENSNQTAQNRVIELEQAQKNNTQNQSRLILELQNKAQQSELLRQKLQQQLMLTEQNSIQLQEKLEKLTAENLKNNQNYQLQLADLQQRLLNARRSEQEANRWARAAGVGNTNAANNRILNLQQQIDALSASEENQRSIALYNQQQVNNLQAQLVALQAEIKSEQQSKAQLEKQLTQLEEKSTTSTEDKKTTSEILTSKDNKDAISLNTQLDNSLESVNNKKKQSSLSTEAGIQKL